MPYRTESHFLLLVLSFTEQKAYNHSYFRSLSPEHYAVKHKAFTVMRHFSLTMETEAQQVLDELWAEKLLPFQMNVGKLTKGMDQYTIHFYDSRLRTTKVPVLAGRAWQDMVRKAVLARVGKLSGPLGLSIGYPVG